jgi:hypothetical protein
VHDPVVEYFRCPEELVRVAAATASPSPDPGYFFFGESTIVYGNCASGATSRTVGPRLHDALLDVGAAEDGTLRLSLDPAEIVENLRRERYREATDDAPGITRALYYRLRPYLPIHVRKHLQRRRLRHWDAIPFPRWPVDRTVEQVLERVLTLSMKARGLHAVPFVWFWPEGARSCAIMTHDVEELAGRDFCSQLMSLDESAGIPSSFQIVPEGRYPIPKSFLDEIRGRGFEVNIHDLNHDGRLFESRDEFLHRVGRINEYAAQFRARGFRSGALYRNQAWFDMLDFSYDMSVPSVAHLDPQRGGCCSAMPFFIGAILELPLTTIQDYTLFHILDDYSLDIWKRQLRAISGTHGLASFIVHPDYIVEGRAGAVYRALLDHLGRMRADEELWIARPGDVDRWWRQRSQMRVVQDAGQWRIVGPGRERARLAFAALDGDTLRFTVERAPGVAAGDEPACDGAATVRAERS